MPRLRTALLASAWLLGACKADEQPPTPQPSSPSSPAEVTTEVSEASERDVRPVAAAGYARTLEQQLDLISPDADAYLVIRDLRPLIAQARRIEQVMAGPLARAIPALAKIGGGTGDARLAQLARARDLLALLLAGLEGSGVALDQGLVFVQGQGAPVVVFAAADLDRLGALASLAGLELDLGQRCAALDEPSGWFACRLGGDAQAPGYRPAGQGAALAKRLGDRLGGVELERTNVAVSMAGIGEAGGSLDAVLRTDPGLWELSLPVPLPPGQDLLAAGPAPALRALVPGTSFMWARVDPRALARDGEPVGPIDPSLLTGELWFGAVDAPDGFAAQLGITDAGAVADRLQGFAASLPEQPLTPAQLDGVSIEFDRASIQLDGERIPTIGMRMTGDAAAGWAETLGVPPRVRIWAQGGYLSAALGEVQAIPTALAGLGGVGPSAGAIAGLPPTLARALLAGEVGLIVHLVLDDWQAPPSEAELDSLLAGVPSELRPDASGIAALFQALAPWSSCAVWLRGRGQGWIANLSLVPFAAAADGASADELAAAAELLDRVLAGADGQAGYRELLARFPGSPWAPAYRARVGDAPEHHGVVGMIELGLLAALVVPALEGYLGGAEAAQGE